MYSTVLLITCTLLCNSRALWYFHLSGLNFYPLNNSPPPLPGNHHSTVCFYACHCSRYLMSVELPSIFCVSVCDWLISLRIMSSRLIHIVDNGRISFFLGCIIVHCITPLCYIVIFFIDLSVNGQMTDEWMCCFQLLLIVNNAAINMGL